MPIPIAKISVAPIEMPIDELVKMIRPYMICQNCKFYMVSCGDDICTNSAMLSIMEDLVFNTPSDFGCNFWESNGR